MLEGLGSGGVPSMRRQGIVLRALPAFLGGVNDCKPVKNVSSLCRKVNSWVDKNV